MTLPSFKNNRQVCEVVYYVLISMMYYCYFTQIENNRQVCEVVYCVLISMMYVLLLFYANYTITLITRKYLCENPCKALFPTFPIGNT